MKGETLFVVILAVLLLISGVQVAELVKISEKISADRSGNGVNDDGYAGTALSGMDSVPDMVGGC